MMDNNTKAYLRDKLAKYRYASWYVSMHRRLTGLPFSFSEAVGIFNIEESLLQTPCTNLGRHLVLKIIDGILDGGGD